MTSPSLDDTATSPDLGPGNHDWIGLYDDPTGAILFPRSVWRAACQYNFPRVESDSLRMCLVVASQSVTFVVSDIGTCLFLKLCGFVEEHRAEIRDVSETHLRLRWGGSWLHQLWCEAESPPPLDMLICFSSSNEGTSRAQQTQVEVVVRDVGVFTRQARFESAARRVIWQLRNHLLVG